MKANKKFLYKYLNAYAPEEGPCDVYVKCSENSVRVLCNACVQRSLTNLGKVTQE